VLFEMLERGIRHAPVVSERGQLVGVVEDADLFAVQPRSWFGARRAIARAQEIDTLVGVAGRLPGIMVDLHAASLRALEVARVLSALVDALTVRVLELVGREFALPGDGIVWVALGSQARRELTPASAVLGAVVCSESPPDGWAQAAADALGRCGLARAVVARTPVEWLDVDLEDEQGLTVLVERRALWGTPREPLPVASGETLRHVLDALAARALALEPPTGFDADAVLGGGGSRSDRLDIRLAAVIPVVELARWAGAAAGCVEGSTPERLRAAAEREVLTEQDASTLSDAFELALELRIAHHMEQLSAGRPADDQVETATISPLARDHLRDVFRAVAGVQRRLRG
jgi:CBS domain-containing protein